MIDGFIHRRAPPARHGRGTSRRRKWKLVLCAEQLVERHAEDLGHDHLVLRGWQAIAGLDLRDVGVGEVRHLGELLTAHAELFAARRDLPSELEIAGLG